VLPAVAAFINATFAESRSRLDQCAHIGELGWSVRNGPLMEAIGNAIRELPLDEAAEAIGEYFVAQALNRQGPARYREANIMLEHVIDRGPLIYRAKALTALGTNTNVTNGAEVARPIYAEASRVSARCEGNLQPAVSLVVQSAVIRHLEGDKPGALALLQSHERMARELARIYPASAMFYFNNLAVALTANGRLDEAEPYINLIRHSPYAKAYPEWGRTCQEFDALRALKPSGSVAVLELPRALDIGEDHRPDSGSTHSELLSPTGMPLALAAKLETQYTSSVDGVAASPVGVSHNTAEPVEGDAKSNQSAQRTEGVAAVQLSPRLYRHLQPNRNRARTPKRVPAGFCFRRGAVASPALARGDSAMRMRRDPEAASNRHRHYRPGSPRSPPSQPVTA